MRQVMQILRSRIQYCNAPRLSNHSDAFSCRRQARLRRGRARRGRRCAYDLRRAHAWVGRVGRRRLLLRSILVRAQVAQRLVGPLAVVPLQPRLHHLSRVREAGEVLLPHALLLETPKEALDQPVLLRRVGRDVLLVEPVEAAGRTEVPAQEHQPVVAAQHRCGTCRSQRSKARQTRHLQRPFRFLGASAQRKLPAHHLAVVAIDHRH